MRLPTKFGPYGGVYVAELLVPVLEEIESGWIEARDDQDFRDRLAALSRT
jgi:tryptophan synthase beta chain